MHDINKSELVSKILVNVLLITLFIGVFFFTYGSYIEGKIVKNQMEFLASNIKDSFGLFGKNTNDFIITKINEIKLPDLSREDKKAEENNEEIKMKAFKFLLLFSLFVVFCIYLIYVKNNNNNSYELNKIISENIIILIGIGVTEYVFLTYFAARFTSIDPNQVKKTVLSLLNI